MLLKRRPVFETGPEGGKVESAVFPKLWLEIFFFLNFLLYIICQNRAD